MEKTSLVPIPKSPNVISVDTNNVWSYLLDKRNYSGSKFQTAQAISLPSLEPGLKEMYDAARVDFIHDEATRLEARQNAERVLRESTDPNSEFFQMRLDRELRRADVTYGKKEEMERYRGVYFDYKARSYSVGPISEGKAYSVTSDIFDTISRGDEPLLEIHTHPRNSLLSSSDYGRMLIGADPQTRVLKGGILLCPDFQILALATPQTPLLEWNLATQLIQTYDDYTGEDDEHIKWLSKWNVRIPEISQGLANRALIDGFHKMEDYVQTLVDAGITHEEIERQALLKEKEIDAVVDKRLDSIYQKSEKVGSRVSYKLHSFLRATENRDCWEFARDIGVQLYISEDMQNYQAFS